MEHLQNNNLKVAVIGGNGNGRLRSLKSVPDLEQLIGMETNTMTTEDYYAGVATLFRCVNLIANSVASMPRQIEVVDTGQVVAQANFQQPELDDNGRPLDESNLPFSIKLNRILFQTCIALQLRAEAFWHKERNLLRQTAVVWQDPKLIKPKRDDYGIVGFEKHLRGRKPIPIPVEEMTYFYIPGLRENAPGVSPAQVALQDAGIIYHQNAFLNRFFENGAMPTTLFFMDDGWMEPNTEEKNRIKRFLYTAMTGRLRSWGIELLSSKLKFEHLVPPLKEMVMPELRTEAQQDICTAMGVPISVLYTNASRNSTSEQDDLHFYTKTAVPQARDIEETANDEVFGPFGLRLRFRPDKLEVFQQQELSKLQGLSVVAGDLSKDERRAAAGYPPTGDDDAPDVTDDANADDAPLLLESGGEDGATKRYPLSLTQAEYELMQRDMALWESKVLKRMGGKQPPASIAFESLFISAPVAELVRGQLRFAQTNEEVKAAFAAPFRVFQRQPPPPVPPRFAR